MSKARVKSRSSHLQKISMGLHYIYNFFFLFESLSLGLAYLMALFFKMSLLLSYKSTSLRKKHHFLEVFRVIKFFIRFFSLKRVNLKKRATRSASPRDKLSNKKQNCIYNEGPWRFFGAKMTYFWPLFCSYLRQMSGYGAENFITASSLQPQHMLQISAHLYVPGLRSIFEGGGGLKLRSYLTIFRTKK